jgi:hypothetical protein
VRFLANTIDGLGDRLAAKTTHHGAAHCAQDGSQRSGYGADCGTHTNATYDRPDAGGDFVIRVLMPRTLA